MNEKVPLQAVVFDLDGLIANTEDLYELTVDEVLRRRDKPHDRELRLQMMGRTVADSMRIMIEYHSLADLLDDVVVEVETVITEMIATSLAPMPGMLELLGALERAGVRKAIATSGLRRYAENVLSKLGIQERFEFTLTAEDIRRGKPDPDVYLLAASRLQLAPQAMMVLEDSANGCRAGVASGAFTVAVPNRHTRMHEFPGARFVADTLADPRIYEELGIPR